MPKMERGSDMNQLHGLIMQSGDFAFHPATGESYTLNATGRDIIRLLCAGHQMDSIANQLAIKWNLTLEKSWSDLLDFTARLRACGLLG
jgi:hypothetical protein